MSFPFNQRRNTRGQFLPTEKRKILSSLAPSNTPNTPLAWRVRQYVNDDGASHEPTLAEITDSIADGQFVSDWMLYAYKGFILDNAHEQYQHKMYSVRIITDQAVTIPIQLYWPKQIVIITSVADVDTTQYTTGTDDNAIERLTLDLSLGVNDLSILTYTGVANPRLELSLDLSSIYSSAVVIDSERMAMQWII